MLNPNDNIESSENQPDSIKSERPKFFKRHRRIIIVFVVLVALGLLGSLYVLRSRSTSEAGIHKIKHIVIIMQENRSFDSYFGTFPGADGIPMKNGVPTVCVPNPTTQTCDKPYLDNTDKNAGGPHGQTNATADINGGKMDGFIGQTLSSTKQCAPNDPSCGGGLGVDVMGYHDGNSLANYWAYAKNYTLDDHLFQSNASWSLPEHLYLVSEWSAKCCPVMRKPITSSRQPTRSESYI
jgi:phospholipase C